MAGSTGAAISTVCTYPLSLIITRLQIQRQLRQNSTAPHLEEYNSIWDAAQKIYSQEGGLGGFYVGLLQDTNKSIADSFLFFLAYNLLRQSRLKPHNGSSKHLSVVDELSTGFLAGAFSKLFTTPIANIVTRKQSLFMTSQQSTDSMPPDTSARSIARQIRTEKGLQGFWSGYSASLVLALNPSVTFFLFETFKRTLLPRSQRSNPSPQAIFFLAAFSKAIASTITYPFSLAKTRSQASFKNSSRRDQQETIIANPEKYVPETKTHVPSSVFGVILQIVRNEGVGALYTGLDGEILKGFFSHGITMIVKDSVHKLIIQLYYTVLKLLKRYPGPQDLMEATQAHATYAVDSTKRNLSQAADFMEVQGVQIAETATVGTTNAVESTKAKVTPFIEPIKDGTNRAISAAEDGVQKMLEQGQGLRENTSQIGPRTGSGEGTQEKTSE